MVEKKEITSSKVRDDGFIDKGSNCSESIVEKYTLVEHVKMVGENETDFSIVLVPELIEKYDIQKEINEAAKSATLKAQIEACIRSGGNPETDFMIRENACGDISDMPEDLIDAHQVALAGKEAANKLPDELKKEGMTQEEFDAAIMKILIDKGIIKDETTEKVEEGKTNE